MPATVTIDDDLARLLHEAAGRSGAPVDEIVAAILRRTLSQQAQGHSAARPFRVRPHHGAFATGIEMLKLNQLAGEPKAGDTGQVMILPDLNLLVYAYNSGAPDHSAARKWWEDLMNGDEPIGLSEAVAVGFIRLVTNPKVLQPPMLLAEAVDTVKEWFRGTNVTLVTVTDDHWAELEKIGWAGPAVSDGHLAALAITHNCELHSNDTDFAACLGLRWRNPLAVHPMN